MKTIVARIERIRSGHSDRALVHAIDNAGREQKIEVSPDELRDLPPGEGHLLVMSWSIHENPIHPAMTGPMPQATPSATPTAQAPPAPSSVDAQFMALMSRAGQPRAELDRSSDTRVAAAQASPGTTPDEQLANMLGMPRDHKPTT